MTNETIRRILRIARECDVPARLDERMGVIVLELAWSNASRGTTGVDYVPVTSVRGALLELGF